MLLRSRAPSATTVRYGNLFAITSLDSGNSLVGIIPHQQNQFGAAVGGPIDIPWRHSSAPKTFFFASYEGFRNHTTAATFFNTPTPTN